MVEARLGLVAPSTADQRGTAATTTASTTAGSGQPAETRGGGWEARGLYRNVARQGAVEPPAAVAEAWLAPRQGVVPLAILVGMVE